MIEGRSVARGECAENRLRHGVGARHFDASFERCRERDERADVRVQRLAQTRYSAQVGPMRPGSPERERLGPPASMGMRSAPAA